MVGENEERHCAVVCVCGGAGPTLLSEKIKSWCGSVW